MRRQLSAMTWISRPLRLTCTMSPRKSTNAALVCRGTVWPSTRRISCRAPPAARACHGGSLRSRAVPRGPATAAASDRVGRALGWPFSHRPRRPPRGRAVHIQPNHVRRLGLEVGSSDCMYRSKRCGCSPARRHALLDEVVMNLQQADRACACSSACCRQVALVASSSNTRASIAGGSYLINPEGGV